MIVKMKKVSLVSLQSSQGSDLDALKECGVVHLVQKKLTGENLDNLWQTRERYSRYLQMIPGLSEAARLKKRTSGAQPDYEPFRQFLAEYKAQGDDVARTEKLVEFAADLAEKETQLCETLRQLNGEISRIQPLGDYPPKLLGELAKSGIQVYFTLMSEKDAASLPGDIYSFALKKDKKQLYACLVSLHPLVEIPGKQIISGELGLNELRERQENLHSEQEAIKRAWAALTDYRAAGMDELAKLAERISDAIAAASLDEDGTLVIVSGFVPVNRLKQLEEAATRENWALLVRDPEKGDLVPTFVETIKPIGIIKPMFQLLEVTPGYLEYDISLWFLLFFSVFFAMIIGDAGYGVFFLILTLIARLKMKKAPPEPFFLLTVTSLCTIIWGALTGTWFGSKELAATWPLSLLVVNSIASFPLGEVNTMRTVMRICFIIAVIQLSLAHLTNLIAKIRSKSLEAISQFGWLIMVWGIFLLVQEMVLKMDLKIPLPLTSLTLSDLRWFLLGSGFVLVILFEKLEGGDETKPPHGLVGKILNELKSLPIKLLLKFLSSISAFADSISYVRLFAVGLASLEVAKAFNSMAAGVGFTFPMGFFAALILMAGHLLNIVMGAMSLVVHGVRLNMLEFSGHLGMEWSGIAYEPYRKKHS